MGFGGFGGFKSIFKGPKKLIGSAGGAAGSVIEAPFRLLAPDIDMPDVPEDPAEIAGEVPTLPDPDSELARARRRRGAAQQTSSRLANISGAGDSIFKVGNGLGG